MKEETKKRNEKNWDEVQRIIRDCVKPNITIAIGLIGYGFQDGFGDNYFKEIPHFGIGVVGKSKNWTCYMLFDDEIPTDELIISTVKKATEGFLKHKKPYTKKYKNSIRRMIIIERPKTMSKVEISALDPSEFF